VTPAVAARDSSPADRSAANTACTGKDGMSVLLKAISIPDREVVLSAETFDANAGFTAVWNRWPVRRPV
jgi:hypothetical protein